MPIQQSDGHAIGKTVIGGFPRLGMPLLRISPDNLDRHIIAANFDLDDLLEGLRSLGFQQFLPDDERGFNRCLGMVFHGVLLDIRIKDLEGDRC